MEEAAERVIENELRGSGFAEQMEAMVLPPLRDMLIKKLKTITDVGLLLAIMKAIDVAQEKHPEAFLSEEGKEEEV